MSLIRCLGRISLPATYRHFLDREADLYRRKRLYDPSSENEWVQDWVRHEGQPEDFIKNHVIRGAKFPVKIPKVCTELEARLAKLYKGKQTHTAMTVVSTPFHTDDFDNQNATVLLIPHKVSDCHYLIVEGEERQLKAGHIYAFSQFRSHSLVYANPRGESSATPPCSVMSISFEKFRN